MLASCGSDNVTVVVVESGRAASGADFDWQVYILEPAWIDKRRKSGGERLRKKRRLIDRDGRGKKRCGADGLL